MRDAVYPFGSGGPNASFALLTSHYARTYGVRAEEFGKLCVAQRDNALQFPLALFKKPLTLQEYLNARPIADPLRLFDCVMPCAGAEGFLVMRREMAENLGLAACANSRRPSNATTHFPTTRSKFAAAGRSIATISTRRPAFGPDDIDLIETYDDYPVINFMQLEDLGFCAKGEAAAFVRAHSFTVDGDFPFNTSGGQLSVGQAGAAGGFLGLVEALRQVTAAIARGAGEGRQASRWSAGSA